MKKEYPLLPIPGWEGLYATRGDQVISLRSGKPLKPGLRNPAPHRYYAVILCRPGCKIKCVSVHRAVLSANLGRPIADGMEVCHIDGNPLNNLPENLRELKHSDIVQAALDRKRAAGGTTTYHRGVYKFRNRYQVMIENRFYVGYCNDYDTACKMADDAYAGILPAKAQARLDKLKLKKNQSK